jgi:hypothetical protein
MSTTAHTAELGRFDALEQSDFRPDQPDRHPDYQPDYIEIATPLVERGFRVTPVHPETKSAVMKNWPHHQATTPEEVLQHAKYYPHHNVGVVGKRGVGRHCFLDIDADGVLNRIESETGHKMPQTYTVCSRPDSAPYKRHYYFTQTVYSFNALGGWHSKNMNVKDMRRLEKSRSGIMMHPTVYDVKGVGGGSLVVGAGSVRDNGEIYKCIDDSPVVPIPHWLVDWLVADFNKYRVAKDEEQKQTLKMKCAAAAIPDEHREEFRKQGNPDGFDIHEEDIYDFLRWRAFSYAALGETEDTIAERLTYQVIRFCEGGAAFAKSDHGQELIRKIAGEKRRIGNATWFYKRRKKKIDIHCLTATAYKTTAIKEIIQGLPDRISKNDALERIRVGLDRNGFSFDPRRDKNKLMEARKAVGFRVDGLWWKRPVKK